MTRIIKNVVFDVDGVFTDGRFHYSSEGKYLKIFGPHDSDGLKFLKSCGLKINAISADHRGFEITKKRFLDLQIDLNLVDEEERYEYLSKNFNLNSLIYMGDGIHDAKILKKAFFGIAPRNASLAAINSSDYVTNLSGGNGAVFEACFQVGKLFFKKNFKNFIKELGLSEKDF